MGHYSLAQLLDTRSDGILSPLVHEPLGAAWVGNVAEYAGLQGVRALYSAPAAGTGIGGAANVLRLTALHIENSWQEWMGSMVARFPALAAAQRTLPEGTFIRGISFSHEGWRGGGGGYLSAESREQLRRLGALGTNAIAVVPYGFARGANDEALSYTATDETDADLAAALNEAHRLGMFVLLKPQLWVGRGGFTGHLRFDDAATREAWMRSYREFILHYARLAELEGFDLLSVGNELEGLTADEQSWRKLIADVRRVYHGPIVYASNWGREFDKIQFWDALDYISVNNYYPLRPANEAGGAAPRADELLAGADELANKLAAVSRRWRKPVLFTEVGYPSVRGGASEPWMEDARRGISLDEQAAAYEAVFRAFAGRPWFRGMFWWKWPSSGRGGGPLDFSYTPMGKPAEQILREWYLRIAAEQHAAEAGSL